MSDYLEYETALSEALTDFRSLLSSSSSKAWRPIINTEPPPVQRKGKGRAVEEVTVHRKSSKGADVIRAVCEIALPEQADISAFKAVLQTPEVRAAWDRLVEKSTLIEQLDPQTQIIKTDFRLGWPARDTVTVSRTFSDSHTVIYLATSLPRSTDEPTFLRPSPPYVRSHVHLLAWCIQLPVNPPTASDTNVGNQPSTSTHPPTISKSKARIQLFWQWNLKGAVLATHHQQVATLVSNFITYVKASSDTLPLVNGYGRALEFGTTNFDVAQDCLAVEYSIVAEDAGTLETDTNLAARGLDGLAAVKERRRLERSIEILLSGNQGWDISVHIEALGTGIDTEWTPTVERTDRGNRLTFRLGHAQVERLDGMVRVKLTIRRLVGGKIIRINDNPVRVQQVESRNPSSISRQMLDETATVGQTSQVTVETVNSNHSGSEPVQQFSAAANAIGTLIRRSYIYFTSILQEPEAKWKVVTDSRGVTVTQLTSIDPTLTIFKAEATFVGVGVWDVFSTVATPGARLIWDPQTESVTLLDDLSELSSLWQIKTKAAWPAWARDSILVRTAYKSPSCVHIFAFSTSDSNLFNNIPSVPPSTIRVQTDLQGWSIEALSPTTTQITLIEQSDPKGWASKSWISKQISDQVANVGEFAIKNGGPPVLTRLVGAKATMSRYDHEKGSLKLEYTVAAVPPIVAAGPSLETGQNMENANESPRPPPSPTLLAAEPSTMLECEIRCDLTVWAASLDIVTDPPPTSVSCLSRHRLAAAGGGCWITIEHDLSLVTANEDRVLVLVRKGPSNREKGSVFVNGSRQNVDNENLADDEVKLLTTRKRHKASPIPLDQYPTLPRASTPVPRSTSPASRSGVATPASNPAEDVLARFTPIPSAAVPSSPIVRSHHPTPSLTDALASTVALATASRPAQHSPMNYALETLATLQKFHAEQGPDISDPAIGWTLVSEKGNCIVRKRLVPGVSDTVPVLRGDRVVEGVTADQLVAVIDSPAARKQWDERVENINYLESFGNGCTTSLLTTKSAYLTFRGRVFYLASSHAYFRVPSASANQSVSTVHICATASYPQPNDSRRLNPNTLPVGQVLLEGWILETLDPYTSNNFAIPSTRCAYFMAIDYGGSVPAAFGSMMNINPARVIEAVGRFAKAYAVPRILEPPAALQIEGPLNNDGLDDSVWRLEEPHCRKNTTFVTADFLPIQGGYHIILSLPKLNRDSPFPGDQETANEDSPRRFVPGSFQNDSSVPIKPISMPQTRASTNNLRNKVSSRSLRAALASSSPPNFSNGNHDLTPRPSLYEDILVAELIVDLSAFRNGYTLSIMSSFADSSQSAKAKLTPPSNLSSSRDLPIKVTIHEMASNTLTSVALASATPPQPQHLLRLILPIAHFANPLLDPLQEGKRPVQPQWYQRHQTESAFVDLVCTRLEPDTTGRKNVNQRVAVNDEYITVASEKDSRAILEQHEEDWDKDAFKISRIPLKASKSNEKHLIPVLPDSLRSPIALSPMNLPDSNGTIPLSTSAPKDESPFQNQVTPELSQGQNGAAKPTLKLRLPSEDQSAVEVIKEPNPGTLANILGTYPLNKLVSAPTSGNVTPGLKDQAEDEADALSNARKATSQRAYPLSSVLLVAVISFLLGSLLRSLLTPADFVLDDAVDVRLLSALQPDRRWRQAMRLFEIRLPRWFINKDLMCATIAKRT